MYIVDTMKTFFLLLIAVSASAAPVGNPAAPALIRKGFLLDCWVDVRLGYEGDFVSDGRMGQFDQSSGRVDQYQQNTNSGTFTLNLYNRLDMYGVFGSSRTEADWRFEAGETITRIEVETEQNFLWGVGARALVYEGYHMFLALGGRYSACRYTPEQLTSNGAAQSVEGAQCHWRQWQVSADFAYQIDLLTPYIGIKYSNAQTLLRSFSSPISADLTGSNSLKNRIPVGLYVGCSLSNGQFFMLNVEGRLIDEEAVAVSADLKF